MDDKNTVIRPPERFALNFRELWQYRELFYFFTWRNVKVKYKQTLLGIAWAVVQPLGLMLLFTFVFRNFAVHTGVVRYEIHVLSGIILWNFFSSSVGNAAESIIEHAPMIRKVYFPRLVIPGASLLTALFDLSIAFLLFLMFCVLYQTFPGWDALLLFPLAIGQLMVAAFGFSVLLSALNVKFRDFRYLLPFLLQLMFFGSQVIYSLSGISEGFLKYLLALNPLNGVLEIFRAPFGYPVDYTVVWISALSTLFVTSAGIFYFRKTEAFFADLA